MMNMNTAATNQQDAMLKSKNLAILEDQLNYEALFNRKLNIYANYCTDQNLKNLCQQAAQMHKQHYDILLNYLNSHNKPVQ